MSLKLLKQALNGHGKLQPMWYDRPIKDSYDVVIIGGGVHGLACAYYLAKNHGVTNVAVLDKRYIGGGGSGRNTTIIRSNYLTPEGISFYNESVKLYEELTYDLDFNMMFSQRGHLTLAHTDSSLRTMRWRAETNQIQGVNSSVVYPDEIKKMVPYMDTSDHPRYPVMGALYHPPGGIIRHDAVVWGYAHQAHKRGVHIHQMTEATGIEVENNKVTGVQTNRGLIKTGTVLNATAGWASLISDMVGVKLPIKTRPLQAAVSEPVKPFLDTVVVSGTLHFYLSQSDRGEIVMGASVDPISSYAMDASLGFMEGLAGHILELFPALAKVRVLRHWAGLCDMTPDYSPIMGFTPVDGFVVDVGWGTYGFKAGPVSGKRMAELIATNRTPDMLQPFKYDRFYNGQLVGEKSAASVGH